MPSTPTTTHTNFYPRRVKMCLSLSPTKYSVPVMEVRGTNRYGWKYQLDVLPKQSTKQLQDNLMDCTEWGDLPSIPSTKIEKFPNPIKLICMALLVFLCNFIQLWAERQDYFENYYQTQQLLFMQGGIDHTIVFL